MPDGELFSLDANPDVEIPQREIHVWAMPLDLPEAHWQRLSELLNSQETARAKRFYFDRDRRRFIVRRGLLRRTLAAYLEMSPTAVEFTYGERGKPALAATCQPGGLEFNLSDSADMAVLAVGVERPLGVDIEQLRSMPQWQQIATRYFSPTERQALAELPAELQTRGFFNAWTRKEALLKAVGTGLAVPLEQAEVEVRPGEPVRVLAFPGDPAGERKWWLTAWDCGAEYLAALATPGEPSPVKHFAWQV